MKAIINGRRYDTAKAIKVGRMSVGNADDLGQFSQELYRTPVSGRFFLAGSGGPRSQYAEYLGENSWSGGEKIIPLDRKAAIKWAERHCSADEIDAAFSDQIEDA
jgi:hypothetical protein